MRTRAARWLPAVMLFGSALASDATIARASNGAAGEATTYRVRIATANPHGLAAELEALGYDVLEEGQTASALEVVVSQEELAVLRQRGLRIVAVERGRPLAAIVREGQAGIYATTGYPDLAAVMARMNATAASYPHIVQVVNITRAYNAPPTFEGRDLYAMKVSDNVAVDEDESAVLLVSAHHAREIVTPVIALYALEQLATRYGSDPRIAAAVNDHEIWIAPVWNPDGYNHVFTVDNNWRKNRRDGVGVDLNRNYPQGWSTACSGSTLSSSSTYKGAAPASEPETQAMMMWSRDRRFAKVIDYHSSGRQVLSGYAIGCLSHPFDAWFDREAMSLATASGFAGATRPPSADGEQYEWQFAQMGGHAFLIETADVFQPPYQTALNEAALVFPGILWLLERGISVSGHVVDRTTGQPLEANIAVANVAFPNGETNGSNGRFGRYHVFLPPGAHDLRLEAAGYLPETRQVNVTASSAQIVEVALARGGPQQPPPGGTNPGGGGPGQTPGTPSISGGCSVTYPLSPPRSGPLVLLALLAVCRRRRGAR